MRVESPLEKRLSRERMLGLAGGYYSGGEVDAKVFYGECYRIDNGRPSADCARMPVQVRASRSRGRGRRYVVTGTVVMNRQVVFSLATVDVDGKSWLVTESLRLNRLEKIDRIETTWTEVPYGSETPFEQAVWPVDRK